jgi:hypothetical protein
MMVSSIPFFMASIAFPIDMKKTLFKAAELRPQSRDELNVCINTIIVLERAMSRFSEKALNEFTSIPEISLLLLNYLSKVKNKEYEEYYEMLKEAAERSLQKFTQGEGDGISEERKEAKVLNLIYQQTLF